MTDETFDTENAPESDAPETPETAIDETATDDAAPEGDAAADGADEAPTGEGEGAEAPAEVKPREVIKGIHPELLCQDPECAPEFTELQFFSPEEVTKTKGKTMLFCARSGKKYFSPAVELQAWIAENKIVKTGRGRKDG